MKNRLLILAVALAASPALCRAQEAPVLQEAQDEAAHAQEQGRHVLVVGEVAQPGAYGLKPGEDLANLLARVGGPTAAAKLSRLVIWRGQAKLEVDFRPSCREEAEPVPLHEGDVVVVPENRDRVFVLGAVDKPGSYILPDGGTLSVSQALALAGLFPNVAEAEVSILRQTLSMLGHGIDTRVVESFALAAESAPLKLGRLLRPQDIVYVSKAKARRYEGGRIADGQLWLLHGR